MIVHATGFHVTDIPFARRVFGSDGRSLHEVWDGSPQAYKGTAVPGYPNLFFLLGPNTGLGHNSIVYMIEAQIAYVMDALRTMRTRRARTRSPSARRRSGPGTTRSSASCRRPCGTPAAARAGTSTRTG